MALSPPAPSFPNCIVFGRGLGRGQRAGLELGRPRTQLGALRTCALPQPCPGVSWRGQPTDSHLGKGRVAFPPASQDQTKEKLPKVASEGLLMSVLGGVGQQAEPWLREMALTYLTGILRHRLDNTREMP